MDDPPVIFSKYCFASAEFGSCTRGEFTGQHATTMNDQSLCSGDFLESSSETGQSIVIKLAWDEVSNEGPGAILPATQVANLEAI